MQICIDLEKAAIVAVSAGGEGLGEPNKTTAKKGGPPPLLYSHYVEFFFIIENIYSNQLQLIAFTYL